MKNIKGLKKIARKEAKSGLLYSRKLNEEITKLKQRVINLDKEQKTTNKLKEIELKKLNIDLTNKIINENKEVKLAKNNFISKNNEEKMLKDILNPYKKINLPKNIDKIINNRKKNNKKNNNK